MLEGMTTPYLVAVLLLSLLAVARVTRILTIDKIMEPARMWVLQRNGREGMYTYGVHCPWCMSIWFGALAGALLWWATPVGDVLAGEGLHWWWAIPMYTLVASWATGVLRGMEE